MGIRMLARHMSAAVAFIEPMHRNKPNITYLLTYMSAAVCTTLTTSANNTW